MRVIGIVNQKGGVAKTTTARETAAMLAAGGHPTVAIDLDGQHDLTGFFLDGAAPAATVTDVLEGRAGALGAVEGTGRDGLDILGADDRAYGLARPGVTAAGVSRLVDGLSGSYEYAVVDFPRLVSPATIAALGSCDAVVVPTEAGRASAEAADATLATLDGIRGERPAFLLITRHNARTTIGRQYAEILGDVARDHGAVLLESRISQAAAASEAEGYGLTIAEHRPRSKPAREYAGFLRELMGSMGWE